MVHQLREHNPYFLAPILRADNELIGHIVGQSQLIKSKSYSATFDLHVQFDYVPGTRVAASGY